MKLNPARATVLASEVEELNEQVRLLAINLAAFLARDKDSKNRFASLEPDFQRLVSGLVTLVSEVSNVLSATHHAPSQGSRSEPDTGNSMRLQLSSLRALCHDIQRRLTAEKPFPTP
jgi:hypothetical protein